MHKNAMYWNWGECNKILMDIKVRTQYHIYRKRRERFMNDNTGQLITTGTY